jgi:hypothetical protein
MGGLAIGYRAQNDSCSSATIAFANLPVGRHSGLRDARNQRATSSRPAFFEKGHGVEKILTARILVGREQRLALSTLPHLPGYVTRLLEETSAFEGLFNPIPRHTNELP